LADGALADLKVVEYADSISGSYCGKLMADLGADVIKIEAPTSGDTARKTGPFPNDIPDAEKSGLFLYLNTNKRSVTLDLTTKAGADIFRELVKTADVLIENTHPSTMAGLGLDYESLSQINPRLVMTSVTPFGQSGPYSQWKGNDLICTHMSGLAFHTPMGGRGATCGRLAA
jgi:crotonobetainyl-CoA:carnitine CoA-transferase CaiB-like acyl-CoA transferase